MRCMTILVVWLAMVAEVQAHDCFLMAKPFRPVAGERPKIAIHIHDDFPGQHVAWNPNRILRFHHWFGGVLQLSESPKPSPDSSGVFVNTDQPGVHLIALDWAPRLIEIDGTRFTNYLKSEGLSHVIKARADQQLQDQPGRERYSRYIKTLVFSGEGNDRAVRTVVGQTMEIVPLDNPYARVLGDSVRFQLLFRGQPLAGALVSATFAGHGAKNHHYAQSGRTDRQGVFSVRMTHAGAWLVRTVHMLPRDDDMDADWESWWASVTFEMR
jgi:hypothetical protein